MNQQIPYGEDVALFIDWENFKISLATGHRQPNVSALKEEVSNHGRVVVAKAYADWVARTPELRGASQFINDPPALYAAGIEPVYVPTRLFLPGSSASSSGRTTRIKNSVDVKMTADCIECAHTYPNISTYVLVSGDSDFIHVINTLRTMGKRVIVIGVSWATSRRLYGQVDGLILYDADVDPITPSEPVPSGNGRATHKPTSQPSQPSQISQPSQPSQTSQPNSSRLELAEVIRAIEEIVREERRAGGTPLLTSIKQRLMRRFTGFDEKNVGFSGFKKLMVRVAQEGNIKLVTAGLVDWATMADEPSPEEDTLEQPDFSDSTTAPQGRRDFRSRPATPVQALPEADEQEADPQEPEAVGAPKSQAAESQATESEVTDIGALMAEAIGQLNLPDSSEDGLDAQRISDLVVMADALEQQEGISHVAFNFLAAEVSKALESGLEAGQEEITLHWGQNHSHTYVSRMLRSLGKGNLFKQGWHSWRDEESGRSRRRRTFYLDRTHPLVQGLLKSHWNPADAPETIDTAPEEALQEEPPRDFEPQGELYSVDPLEEDSGEEGPMPGNEAGKPEPSFISRLFGSRRQVR